MWDKTVFVLGSAIAGLVAVSGILVYFNADTVMQEIVAVLLGILACGIGVNTHLYVIQQALETQAKQQQKSLRSPSSQESLRQPPMTQRTDAVDDEDAARWVQGGGS